MFIYVFPKWRKFIEEKPHKQINIKPLQIFNLRIVWRD